MISFFSKILKNHFQHLNIIFNLFDKLEITFKEIKTHLNASKQHEFDVMIYHMQNDHDDLLDHTMKEN